MIFFSIEEFVRSDTAKRYGIDNRPDMETEGHIREFIETILDGIRGDWGRPVYVSSGFRCLRLNRLVGGAALSGHRYGWCADLRVKDRSIREFAIFVKSWMERNGYAWDELVFERSGRTEWVHFAWKGYGGRQRMKCFDIIK